MFQTTIILKISNLLNIFIEKTQLQSERKSGLQVQIEKSKKIKFLLFIIENFLHLLISERNDAKGNFEFEFIIAEFF